MQQIPNALTLLRLLIAPLIGALLLLVALGDWTPTVWLPIALGLFLIACVTDFVDGALARRLSAETTSGAVLDPVADKLLMLCTGLGLVVLAPDLAIAGAVLLMLARDLAVGGLRELALSRGHRLTVGGMGKAKTLLQCLALGAGLVDAVLQGTVMTASGIRDLGGLADSLSGWLIPTLFWIATAISLVSAADYLRAFRAVSADQYQR